MAGVTPKGGLLKPTDGEAADNVVLNANFDKIGAHMGAFECTSSSRPAQPWYGLTIRETDTGFIRVWDGSKWDWVAGRCFADWLNPDLFNVDPGNTSWGPGNLTLVDADSAPAAARPGAVGGAAYTGGFESVQLIEAGLYDVEATITWGNITSDRSYIEIIGGVALPTERTFRREGIIGEDNGGVYTRVFANTNNYKIGLRLYCVNAQRRARVRLKITRVG